MFELDLGKWISDCDVPPAFDILAVTNTVREKQKATGAMSSDLRPIWLPTLDTLRSFFLFDSNEIYSAVVEITRFPALMALDPSFMTLDRTPPLSI